MRRRKWRRKKKKDQSTPTWQSSFGKKEAEEKKKKKHNQTLKRGAALCGDINRGDKDKLQLMQTKSVNIPHVEFPPQFEEAISVFFQPKRAHCEPISMPVEQPTFPYDSLNIACQINQIASNYLAIEEAGLALKVYYI